MLLSKKHGVLTRFTDPSETRPVLACVHLTKRHAEAADGFALLRIPLGDGVKDADFPPTPGAGKDTIKEALIPGRILGDAIKSLPKSAKWLPILGYVRLTAQNGNIVLSTTDSETSHDIVVKPCDGTFPNTDQLIPKHRRHGEKGTVVLALGVKQLEQLLYAVKGLEAEGVKFQVDKPKKGTGKVYGSSSLPCRVEFTGGGSDLEELHAVVGLIMPLALSVEQPKVKPKKAKEVPDETGQVEETVDGA